jgi:hypothetical protein
MNSKQIFMIVVVIAALSMVVMIASPVMAQNITGGNMTGGNMTGTVSSIDSDFLARSGCPVDAEGIERCSPSQDSNRDTNENGNGNDASGDENEEDSSDGNENGEN